MTTHLHADNVIQAAQTVQRDRRHMAALIAEVVDSPNTVEDDGTVIARLNPHLYAALRHRAHGDQR